MRPRVFQNLTIMSALTVILILLVIVLAIAGLMGAVLPAIPGPPLSFGALLIAYYACPGAISLTTLLVWLAVAILVTVFDYVAPILLTKWGGGSTYATWGATVGIIAGLLFMPVGLILGPLVGAFAGEMLHGAMHEGTQLTKSLRVALFSFVSFLLTTGLKLVSCLVMAYYSGAAIWHLLTTTLAGE